MLLIHLLLSSVSLECPSSDSFLRLFRNYVYSHFIFPKINNRGVGIRARGLENFSKSNKRGDDYSVLKSTQTVPVICLNDLKILLLFIRHFG